MAVRISEDVWKDTALLERNREQRLRDLETSSLSESKTRGAGGVLE